MSDGELYEIGVYGHSDDLIEVVGDVQEEFYALDTPAHIMVGDTEIVAEYDGEWHFEVVDQGEADKTHWYSVGRKKVVEECNDYTEAISVETPTPEARKLED